MWKCLQKNKYIILTLLIIPAYYIGWQVLTDPATTFTVWQSKFTVNILIIFYIVGRGVDKYTKGMPRWKGWSIWLVVTLTMILFFKYVGGLETLW